MTSSASSRVAHPPRPSRPGAPDVTASRRGWLLAAPVVAVLALVAALVLGGGAPDAPPRGLPDPGVLTTWGLPVARLVFDLCVVGVLGLLATTLLLPADGFAAPAAGLLRATAWFAWAWALSAAVVVVLTVSDVLGVPAGAVLGSEGLIGYVWQLSQSRSLLLALACGVLVGAYTRWTGSRQGVAALLAVAVAGLLPVLFAGHSAAASDHDLASSSLVVHVLGAAVWVGGLLGVLLLRHRPPVLAVVLPRYSAVALACFVCVAASGLINAWVRTSGDLALWAVSGYGALLAVKIGALVALGVAGWLHRRGTLAAVSAGRPRAFARLAAAETLVMAGTVAVAVALARTPPPAGATVDVPAHGSGHPTLGSDVEPFGAVRLLTEWRLEAVSLTVLAVAFACYLGGWRRVRRAGEPWPGWRLAAAAAATALAVLATSGGLGTYSTATFSAQVGQFLVLFVVVPVLVALSAPATLAARAGVAPPSTASGSRAVAALTDPLNMLIVATVLLFALYATPLLEQSLQSAPLHLAVNLCTLVVGCLFWWSVLGVDPVQTPRPRSYRLWVLAGFLVLMVSVGARIYLSQVLLAGAWFSDLGWAWVDLPADQRRGAGLMGGGALLLGPLLVALVVTGARVRGGRSAPASPASR